MDHIEIEGGVPLKGNIAISGAKNAALPLLAACLLCDDEVELSNIPPLADINSMVDLLSHLGLKCEMAEHTKDPFYASTRAKVMRIDSREINNHIAPYDMVRKMRASVLVLGPLLARIGIADVSLPGGCAIGARPVDLHIDGLRQMGADIEVEQGYLKAKAPKNGLQGADIMLRVPSVGATENLMTAATLANGTTTIMNAAREPEISALGRFLNQMGANITGLDSSELVIKGVAKLSKGKVRVAPDRIEAGSHALAAAMTGGEVVLDNAPVNDLQALWALMRQANIPYELGENSIKIKPQQGYQAVNTRTEAYPGFATDLQAQFMALMTMAQGTSVITEAIFENRFMHVPELMRMGADISLNGNHATIKGVGTLKAANVMATDLRASISLVIAALKAEGVSQIHRVYHLDRGYGRLVEKLESCGAKIRRIKN